MSIEKVRAFFREKGMEDRIMEFDVSSATVELAAEALRLCPGDERLKENLRLISAKKAER